MNVFSQRHLRRAEFAVVASAVCFIALAMGAALVVGGPEVLQHIRSLNPRLIAILLGLSLTNYLIRAYRWHVFSKALRVEIPLDRNVLYYFAGFAMTPTPGKVGEALRLWLMQRCHQVRYERTAPLFLADRLSDINAMLVLCLVGFGAFSGYLWATLLAVVGLAAFIILIARPRLLMAAVGLLYSMIGRGRKRLFAKLRRTLRLTGRLFSRKLFVYTTMLGTVGWLAECCAFYLLLQELGLSASLQEAIFIFAFSMVVGAISMLPGGLGGVESVMLGFLVALGASSELAVVATTVIRLTTLWFAIFLGFAVLPIAMRLARRGSNASLQTVSP